MALQGCSDVRLRDFFVYVQSWWVESTQFPIKTWCVYGRVVRTNNDVEGWHNRMNKRVGANPNMYILIQHLKEEADLLPVNLKLVSCGILSSRKRHQAAQDRLFDIWCTYEEGGMSLMDCLDMCSNSHVPFAC
ncbi:uncharacterized protein [Littorina saxatilis]|uniref:uncharacterized protein n=1 Tax=Littorina saxatilis TaxID=31220 RepID=UPI0038B55499